ncbi:MAG: SO_0444 family Cu/Zn efflux transporter [Planctomycetota bacterium]
MIEYLNRFLRELWWVSLEAAPWLLLGLLVAGVIKAWLPAALLQRWLGGRGLWPIIKAAVVGTPLPLCSCSVIPAAIALRRSGTSNSSTVSFLVATPENGADSIALSYALLGPFMMVARPVAAIISAIVAGVCTILFKAEDDDYKNPEGTQVAANGACCDAGSCGDSDKKRVEVNPSFMQKLRSAWSYATDDLFKDIAGWLAIGLVLAALMNTFIPPEAMSAWGSGLLAMLAVMLVGVPMYICATASTPVAASMLLAGVSPGTVLVFLLAGPATNLATIGIVRRELGWRSAVAYLIGVCGTAVMLGLLTDWVVLTWDVSINAEAGQDTELFPGWFPLVAFTLLALMAARVIFAQLSVRVERKAHCQSKSGYE